MAEYSPVWISTGTRPVVAQTPSYTTVNISGSYTEAEVQAIQDQLVTLTTKVRELITDLQALGIITES